MSKSSTLFLFICSGTKNIESPGSNTYLPDYGICSKLSPNTAHYLLHKRNQAKALLNKLYYGNVLLSEYPHNQKIKCGYDFGGDDSNARYLPAIGLYSGRFYSGLGEKGIQKILSSQLKCIR